MLENGAESVKAHVHPDRAPPEWKGAAKILRIGELEAYVEGPPPTMLERWAEEQARVRKLMAQYRDDDEVTEGDPSLSRGAHASEVFALFEGIHFVTELMCDQIDPDQGSSDRAWLRETLSEVALLAFHAGAHARAADGKVIEGDAVRGAKVIAGARKSAEMTSALKSGKTAAILAAMKRQLAEDPTCTVRKAARTVYKQGLGASEEANAKLYHRHRSRS